MCWLTSPALGPVWHWGQPWPSAHGMSSTANGWIERRWRSSRAWPGQVGGWRCADRLFELSNLLVSVNLFTHAANSQPARPGIGSPHRAARIKERAADDRGVEPDGRGGTQSDQRDSQANRPPPAYRRGAMLHSRSERRPRIRQQAERAAPESGGSI